MSIDNIAIESEFEREALDMIDTTSKQVESLANNSESPNGTKYDRAVGGPIKPSPPEWDGKGLPPVGVECEKIFDGKSQIVTPLYYDDHKSGMVMFYYRDSGNGIGWDYDWCLVENCIFLKTESPEQKAERERLEAIETMCNEVDRLPHGEAFAAMATLYDLGYRKESK